MISRPFPKEKSLNLSESSHIDNLAPVTVLESYFDGATSFCGQEKSILTQSLGLDESIITYDRKLRACRRDKANQSKTRVQ